MLETSKVTSEQIIKDVNRARMFHKKWWMGKWGNGEKAYKYYDTDQKPANFPDSVKHYAQLNLWKENVNTDMGILSQIKLKWIASGISKASLNKQRVQGHKALMQWVGNEIGLRLEVDKGFKDFLICGLGYLNTRFNQLKLSTINTMGLPEVKRISPEWMKLDPDGDMKNGLGGRYLFYDPTITRETFQQLWGEHVLPDGEKLNVETIFSQINAQGHFDQNLNSMKDPFTNQKITPVHYEYYRWVKKKIKNPITDEYIQTDDGKGVLELPIQEYRIAILAGNTILKDYISPLSVLKMFTYLVFAFDKLTTGVYSVSKFKELLPIQDLVNVMISMLVNAQARQMTSPIVMLSAAAKNLDKLIQDVGGYKVLLYDYPDELREAGVPLSAAVPQRLQHGNIDTGFFSVLQWILQNAERVQTSDVIKGRKPTGVESGVAINLLRSSAMLPHQQTVKILTEPINLLGKALYQHVIDNMADQEIEIPHKTEYGEEAGIVFNKELTNEEMNERIAAAKETGGKGIESISIRKGKERIALEEWIGKVGDLTLLESQEKFEKANEDIQFIENDITFGEFDVELKINEEDLSKNERLHQSTIIAETMNKVGAPVTALEYIFDAIEDEEKDEWMDKTKKESQIWKLGLQAQAKLEEEKKARIKEEQSGSQKIQES